MAASAPVQAPVHNADVAAVMREIADLLELKGENPFRIRAYRNLARTLDSLGPSVQAMLEQQGHLDDLPGVGADLAGKIAEVCRTGDCSLRAELRRAFPPGLPRLLTVPGLGPRKVMALYQALGIHTLDQLRAAARDGTLAAVRGFGEKSGARILQTLATRPAKKPRITLAAATALAEPLLAWLRAAGGADVVAEVAGSYRRRQETVGDLDIVARAARPAALLQRLADYPDVSSVLAHGGTRASVVLRQGVQVDLRVVGAASYGAALHYFTGSKNHNIALRRLAQLQGFKLSEYGLFADARRVAGAAEHEIFARLGLDDIPPELRENRGEIEAAQAHRLPHLVTLDDLRGDLHVHTTASDGRDALPAMAQGARAAGLSWIAITEHSPGLQVAHGLDAAALRRQGAQIARLNEQLDGLSVLTGCEVDIRPDGTLDLPDDVLGTLDVVLAAVHSDFGLARAAQTERLLRALDHPSVRVLAHPFGRLLQQRPASDIDMAQVLRHARLRGCAVEVNAQPDRLDLDDVWCRAAMEEGTLLAIDSDAHSHVDFAHLRYGIGQARRGWVEPQRVVNTWPLARLRRWLAQPR